MKDTTDNSMPGIVKNDSKGTSNFNGDLPRGITMSQPTIESVIEKKPIKHIIAEYVEKKDLYGLAEYFKAYTEDELIEDEERGRKLYQQGVIDERTRCVRMVRKFRITDWSGKREIYNQLETLAQKINTNNK